MLSEVRVLKLAPAAVARAAELYYVRVRSDVSLNGVNSWIARMAGDAEETPWVQSSLLTLDPEPVMPPRSGASAERTSRSGASATSSSSAAFLVLLVRGHRLRARASARPSIPVASNLVVFALFNLNLIVFLLLLVLLFRNLVKLCFERRHKVIGARFKAKLVLAFLVARADARAS